MASKEGYSAGEWAIALVFGALLLWGFKSCSGRDEPAKQPPLPRAAVSNSSWDGSVKQVKDYILRSAKDPSSVEFIEWSPVQRGTDGTFFVRVKYRAKNSFGGYVVENFIFRLTAEGKVITATPVPTT